ncbi:hypothetical protein [Nonomuraea soli]|uniref:Uncharacterized protein n=1 Tax=Nonomuraea soli TaxID=1032476 RepID=A0A7W0HVY2_9ACTN|nr:hypothetical protein [Nonomuraea soli]MBA2897668.1 hypothetical protein [Nonomuraea soli]
MKDRYQPGQPGPLPAAEPATNDTSAEGGEGCSLGELTAEEIVTARHRYYAAAAEATAALQNGDFLGGEQLFAATYAQTFRAWWDLVEGQVTVKRLAWDHALRRVRSWARHHLTGEAPATRPGTLFDHALAHASRMAARDFLAATGELLTRHLATEPGDAAGAGDDAEVLGPDTPANNLHPYRATVTTAQTP